MSFTMDMSSCQTADDVISLGHGEEIILLGRALEFVDIIPAYQYQLSLPLILANETIKR